MSRTKPGMSQIPPHRLPMRRSTPTADGLGHLSHGFTDYLPTRVKSNIFIKLGLPTPPPTTAASWPS